LFVRPVTAVGLVLFVFAIRAFNAHSTTTPPDDPDAAIP
jgi:hypothetical protein